MKTNIHYTRNKSTITKYLDGRPEESRSFDSINAAKRESRRVQALGHSLRVEGKPAQADAQSLAAEWGLKRAAAQNAKDLDLAQRIEAHLHGKRGFGKAKSNAAGARA